MSWRNSEKNEIARDLADEFYQGLRIFSKNKWEYLLIYGGEPVQREEFANEVRAHLNGTGYRVKISSFKIIDKRVFGNKGLIYNFEDLEKG